MHYSSWLTLAFSASAIARPEGVVDRISKFVIRDVANLPAIKETVEVLTKDGDVLDKAIAALTKENAGTQVDVITKALSQLNTDSSAQAAKMKKSGVIGLVELSGLLSAKTKETWTALAKEATHIVNQTSIDIIAKKNITKSLEPAKLDTLCKAIKSQKKGIMDIMVIVPGQIPPAVKAQIDNMAAKNAAKAAAAPATNGTTAPPKQPKLPDLNDPKTQAAIEKYVDSFLDQVVNIVSGKQEAFIMPALPPGVTLPPGVGTGPKAAAPAAPASGASGDMADMPGMPAAPPAAEAPKTASAPKSKGLPKSPAKGTSAKSPSKQGPAVEYVERKL